jgi:proteasome lid subunit RPN8/RPN11
MTITAKDFDNLTDTVMGWKGNDWELQADRFSDKPAFDWAVVCWYDSVIAMIMARTFLENNHHAFQESYDHNMESWVLLTNYDSFNMAVSA